MYCIYTEYGNRFSTFVQFSQPRDHSIVLTKTRHHQKATCANTVFHPLRKLHFAWFTKR